MVASRRVEGAQAVLKQGGFSDEQTEALIWALELMTDDMVTKTDLQTLKADLVGEIQAVRGEIRAVQVEQIKWMIGLTLGAFALTVGSVLTFIRFLVP